jgi:hypothetical protein
VSFIDDYSCFCWIYLLKHKSDVEQVFYAFQAHVENLLDAKIKSVQSDWGGEYHKLHRYFQRTGISHVCPILTPPSRTASPNASTAISLKLALLYLLTPPCYCAIGMKPSLLCVISLTACPHRSSKRTHWCIASSVSSPTMSLSERLVVRVGLVFASIMLINLHFGLSSVSS